MSIQSIILLCSVPLVAALAARRASSRGLGPDRTTHQVVPGLLIALPIAIYALVMNHDAVTLYATPAVGLTLHVALIGALLATVGAACRLRLPLLVWGDICAPAVLLGIAAVSLSAALDRGWPAALGTETLWQIGGLWALLRSERLLGTWLHQGDTLLLSGVLVAPGTVMGLELRADRLCAVPQLGGCESAFGVAQLLVIGACLLCALALALRHSWRVRAAS